MTFSEALEHMKQGKTVEIPCNLYRIRIVNNRIVDQFNDSFDLRHYEILSDTWEIVEEPIIY